MIEEKQEQPYCKYCIHKGILQDCHKCWINFNKAYKILQMTSDKERNKESWYTAEEIRSILYGDENKQENHEMDIWLDLMAFVINCKDNFDEEFDNFCKKHNISKEVLNKRMREMSDEK